MFFPDLKKKNWNEKRKQFSIIFIVWSIFHFGVQNSYQKSFAKLHNINVSSITTCISKWYGESKLAPQFHCQWNNFKIYSAFTLKIVFILWANTKKKKWYYSKSHFKCFKTLQNHWCHYRQHAKRKNKMLMISADKTQRPHKHKKSTNRKPTIIPSRHSYFEYVVNKRCDFILLFIEIGYNNGLKIPDLFLEIWNQQ